ncbi:MAG TPA: LysE family translocator, partial [Ideonella sp.]|nr:LysE family translocator [Ideonella sp.]
YLIWMGIKLLRESSRSAPASAQALPDVARVGSARIFRDGFVVALLNPKTALFFAAFLPQFMSPDAPALSQSLSLGAVFVLIAGSTDLLYVLLASLLAPRLGNLGPARRHGQRLAGGAFIGLGVLAAFSERPAR